MKVLVIIAPVNFKEEEYLIPKKILEKNNIQVITASKSVKESFGTGGTKAKIDLDIRSVKVDDYDAVVFVGGPGAEVFFHEKSALEIAKSAFEKNKVVAAICIAPAILANAGILAGKKATIWDSGSGEFIALLKSAGAEYQDDDVVQDRRIITANGPHAAEEFGRKIAEALINHY